MATSFCKCEFEKQDPVVLLGSGLMGCMRCNKPIDNEGGTPIYNEGETIDNAEYSKVGNEDSLDQQKKIGKAAAFRTIKFATLFENIGKVLQILNVFGACILIAVGIFISGSGWIRFGYWIGVLILWAFSYVQTSLIRGLASYFQMKASDHLIRNWKK